MPKMNGFKMCPHCEQLKSLTEFFFSQKRYSFASWCKDCTREAVNKSIHRKRMANPKKIGRPRENIKNKKYWDKYQQRKQRAITFEHVINALGWKKLLFDVNERPLHLWIDYNWTVCGRHRSVLTEKVSRSDFVCWEVNDSYPLQACITCIRTIEGLNKQKVIKKSEKQPRIKISAVELLRQKRERESNI